MFTILRRKAPPFRDGDIRHGRAEKANADVRSLKEAFVGSETHRPMKEHLEPR